ncbi:hypothetical protein Tco_0686864 [Tanacetum coccineum]
MQPVAPPSPDYITGLEEHKTPPVPQDEDEREPMFIQPHDPDYVPEHMYPEYIPLEDKHVFPAEEQPLPPIVSPTAESPGYVTESDPEEDPEKYEDDEDEDEDEENKDEEDEDEEEEEEDHLAPPNSAVVVPAVELVSPPKVTEPVTPSPSTDITTTGARIIIRLQASISLPPETPRIASTQALVDAVTVALPSPPLPLSLYIPPLVDRRDDIPEYEVGLVLLARPTMRARVDYGFVSTLDVEERRRGIREVGYGVRNTWGDPVEVVPEIAPMTWIWDEAKLLALREQQRRARQPGPDVRVPDHHDASRDADSHI